MDVLTLSRLQFAAATMFHFIFVPLTLGLSILLAIMETIYVRTGDENYKRLVKFWGKVFLINFAIGVVTGLTLEFQFGTNWARYSKYVGDVFGSLLAIEATVAFFLESVFIAVWAFGWERLSRRTHLLAIWLVALASNLSAFWILAANAWMQHPVGYVIRNGRAELTSLWAIVSQKFVLLELVHTLGAAYVVGGFFVMGVSAYHILRKQHVDLFLKSFRLALVFSLIFSISEIIQGHLNGVEVAKVQPPKVAAMEAHWVSESQAPLYIFQIPDPDKERNLVQIGSLPPLLSMLAYHKPDAVVLGLRDIPKEDRPPVTAVYFSFRLMVALGFYFAIVSIYAMYKRNRLEESRWLLKVMLYSIPLPFIACQLGWIVAEMGRQPWIVYGVMRTRDAVSPIAASQVAISLPAFIVLYSLLGLAAFFLIIKHIRRGLGAEKV
jgi:cytochrome d ubiquinol oxidase subunit I